MASVTMSPASMPSDGPSPLASPINSSSSSAFESQPAQPSPTSEIIPAFVFPARNSMDSEQPPAPISLSVPPGGGSYSRRGSRQGRPAPPPFTFNPGAALADSTSPIPSPSPKTHPILEEMAAHSRGLRSGRPSPLPAFSFNPGAALDAQRTPSPTRSISGETMLGHRRGGSELIGEATTPVLSTSPARSEHLTPRTAMPPHGRGHRHRRSGALSVAEVDLSSIIKANAMAKHRTGSAPGTPADVNSPSFFDNKSPSLVSPTSPDEPKMITPPTSPGGRRESAPSTVARPRVAFSETVSEIPRPLSMVSSGTEDSNTTVRASHSNSGSVASFSSASRSTSSLNLSREDLDSTTIQRPKTAGAFTSLSGGPSSSSLSSSPKRPLSASGPPTATSSGSGSPPLKKKHFWSTSGSDGEPGPASEDENSESTEPNLPTFAPSDSADGSRPRTSPERQASVKKRKVKTWTGVIFSRSKSKHRSTSSSQEKGQSSSTPPIPAPALDEIFDNDDTIVIEEPVSAPPRLPSVQTDLESFPVINTMSRSFDIEDRNTISPVIDLDAALGPFGSEERFPETRKSATAWRRLHSGRSFADLSTPYHRRAESAPHLPPVSRNTLGFSRMGSNPSMTEEVIDEEDEDDYLPIHKRASPAALSPAAGKKPELKADEPVNSEANTPVSPTPQEEPAPEPITAEAEVVTDNIEIVDDEDELSHVGDRSSSSTVLPPPALSDIPKRPASAPMDFAYPFTQGSYASSGEGPSLPGSAISSPEADHISFDSQQRKPNRHLAEPTNEHFLRGSTDDVPSLTDSVSTATGHVPRISSSGNTCSSTDQRSASFSGIATWSAGRASKRASLVSYLIPNSSSHSEKSKLRFGEIAQDDEQVKQHKRKSHRLSRLVSLSFWRSKERL